VGAAGWGALFGFSHAPIATAATAKRENEASFGMNDPPVEG
jgi:hypothetical protein